MHTWAKYLVGLALALPMGGYVAGSLMASAADDPVNRDPVRIQDAPDRSPSPAPAKDDEPGPDDDDPDDDVDDNGVRVVTPQPTRLEDDGGDDGGADKEDRDDGDDRDEDDDRDGDDDSRGRSREGSGDD